MRMITHDNDIKKEEFDHGKNHREEADILMFMTDDDPQRYRW